MKKTVDAFGYYFISFFLITGYNYKKAIKLLSPTFCLSFILFKIVYQTFH